MTGEGPYLNVVMRDGRRYKARCEMTPDQMHGALRTVPWLRVTNEEGYAEYMINVADIQTVEISK